MRLEVQTEPDFGGLHILCQGILCGILKHFKLVVDKNTTYQILKKETLLVDDKILFKNQDIETT